jgi:hypothetical protein
MGLFNIFQKEKKYIPILKIFTKHNVTPNIINNQEWLMK